MSDKIKARAKERAREWYLSNRERALAYRRAHPPTKEKKAEYAKRWRDKNIEKVRKHNRERMTAKYRSNPEEYRKRRKESYRINPEPQREASRRYWREVASKDPDLRSRNSARAKKWHYKAMYGLTEDQVHERLAQQGGKCAICRTTAMRRGVGGMAVDHDHGTGAVRGILCGACNRAIGALKDDPVVIMAAATYLLKHQTANGVAV